MAANRPAESSFRVAVHAQFDPLAVGGVQANAMSLLEALATGNAMDPSAIDVIGLQGYSQGIQARASSLHVLDWPVRQEPIRPPIGALSGFRRWNAFAFRHFGGARHAYVHETDETLRRRGIRAVHFPYQQYFRTRLPSIYEPWDLQHRHLPHLFSHEDAEWRDLLYAYGCRSARYVVVASRWTKNDIVKQYGIDPRRIAIIPRSTSLFERLMCDAPRIDETGPPDYIKFAAGDYCLYPALTYPHKNHQRLLEAIAHLKQAKDLPTPNFVFTGRTKGELFATLQRSVADLGIDDNIQFAGSVSENDLEQLYSCAQMLVFPSLFEGLGLPVLEAIAAGLPICVANSTCLPDIIGEAGITFNASDAGAIAGAIQLGLSNLGRLREKSMSRRGELGAYRWSHALKRFAVLYKDAAGQPLDREEADLLAVLTH